MVRLLLLIATFFALFPKPILAISDPRSVPNNKYGIHVADINDLRDAAALVNTSGGDWGYVTFVIPENERGGAHWHDVFNQLRRLHLIPLVRIASRVQGDSWVIPTSETIRDWVDFLGTLNWPTQNRYVIIYNEPNHAKEWGNTIDPEGYAKLFKEFASQLKHASTDYFVLPAALDVSAHTDGASLDAKEYWRRMVNAEPLVFENANGWNSHSYPNPAFSASPYARGRGTLTSYIWELSYMRLLGIQLDVPVFITETGWVHSQGKYVDSRMLSPEQVARYTAIAADAVWDDKNIAALTPFVLSYQDYPFDHFSWKELGNNEFYAQYYRYQEIPKQSGKPARIHDFALEKGVLPEKLVENSSYSLTLTVLNRGQSIVEPSSSRVVLESMPDTVTSFTDALPTIEPGQKGNIVIHFKTPEGGGQILFGLSLYIDGKRIDLERRPIEVVPPPSLRAQFQLGWRKVSRAQDMELLIYDTDNQIVHKFTDLASEDGRLSFARLYNVVPGREYRVVLVVPGYLPRQAFASLGLDETVMTFERFLPFDLDKNGALNPGDIKELFLRPPAQTFGLFL